MRWNAIRKQLKTIYRRWQIWLLGIVARDRTYSKLKRLRKLSKLGDDWRRFITKRLRRSVIPSAQVLRTSSLISKKISLILGKLLPILDKALQAPSRTLLQNGCRSSCSLVCLVTD